MVVCLAAHLLRTAASQTGPAKAVRSSHHAGRLPAAAVSRAGLRSVLRIALLLSPLEQCTLPWPSLVWGQLVSTAAMIVVPRIVAAMLYN